VQHREEKFVRKISSLETSNVWGWTAELEQRVIARGEGKSWLKGEARGEGRRNLVNLKGPRKRKKQKPVHYFVLSKIAVAYQALFKRGGGRI